MLPGLSYVDLSPFLKVGGSSQLVLEFLLGLDELLAELLVLGGDDLGFGYVGEVELRGRHAELERVRLQHRGFLLDLYERRLPPALRRPLGHDVVLLHLLLQSTIVRGQHLIEFGLVDAILLSNRRAVLLGTRRRFRQSFRCCRSHCMQRGERRRRSRRSIRSRSRRRESTSRPVALEDLLEVSHLLLLVALRLRLGGERRQAAHDKGGHVKARGQASDGPSGGILGAQLSQLVHLPIAQHKAGARGRCDLGDNGAVREDHAATGQLEAFHLLRAHHHGLLAHQLHRATRVCLSGRDEWLGVGRHAMKQPCGW